MIIGAITVISHSDLFDDVLLMSFVFLDIFDRLLPVELASFFACRYLLFDSGVQRGNVVLDMSSFADIRLLAKC